jgi:hypothetical protein
LTRRIQPVCAGLARFAEVDRDACAAGESGVVRHFLALVRGDGTDQLGGQRRDDFPHSLLDQARVTATGQVQEHDEPAGPFDQRAHRVLAAATLAATSRDTVETALCSRRAMTVNHSP